MSAPTTSSRGLAARARSLSVALAVGAALGWGCTSGLQVSPPEGGDDASGGAGPDAGLDAGAASDGGEADAGSDAGLDAGAESFGGGFAPRNAPWGGFGGGTCTATRTPIVFLHGNGDEASIWSRAASDGGPSVLASLRAAGWNECELFGLTWASPEERKVPVMMVHNGPCAAQVRTFLDDVRAYTHMARVDLVGHSMGVTVGLHALEGEGQPAGLRRFVGIAGALRGLFSCLEAGPAMFWLATCWTQSPTDPDLFGFYPDGNLRMSDVGFRALPARLPNVDFSVVYAGWRDQLLDPAFDTALFLPAPNVRAQLDVGAGAPTVTYGPDGPDDSQGVGHFRARANSGPLLVGLLSTDCRGAACCAGSGGACAQPP